MTLTLFDIATLGHSVSLPEAKFVHTSTDLYDSMYRVFVAMNLTYVATTPHGQLFVRPREPVGFDPTSMMRIEKLGVPLPYTAG